MSLQSFHALLCMLTDTMQEYLCLQTFNIICLYMTIASVDMGIHVSLIWFFTLVVLTVKAQINFYLVYLRLD